MPETYALLSQCTALLGKNSSAAATTSSTLTRSVGLKPSSSSDSSFRHGWSVTLYLPHLPETEHLKRVIDVYRWKGTSLRSTLQRLNDSDDVLFIGQDFVDSVADEMREESVKGVLEWDAAHIQQIDQQR